MVVVVLVGWRNIMDFLSFSRIRKRLKYYTIGKQGVQSPKQEFVKIVKYSMNPYSVNLRILVDKLEWRPKKDTIIGCYFFFVSSIIIKLCCPRIIIEIVLYGIGISTKAYLVHVSFFVKPVDMNSV